ncbi:outer membrane beta-barrel family protein [Novosphingobium terrae]|uniref:outer membrane beta-barrel family protein n=1 Tax=Novosphingobium terrae TaxID=2726189 RepID=UPI00197D4C41|nr:outer membrane beta-barrel family protein [Novosphingobium terrae]
MAFLPSPRLVSTLGLLIGTSGFSCYSPALAQTATSPAHQSPGTMAPDIVVSAQQPNVETGIDRKSYAVARDLQATTGSVADVLRNVPSVSVDVDGNLSLRGDSNVQILVDGRPSPQFNNANRAAALEALGANGIERIEVLTNPPANFKPDGSAGVINIITKRRNGSHAASLQSNVGSSGRFNLSGTGSVQIGKLGLHGGLTLRRDLRVRHFSDDRTVTDATTGAVQSTSHIVGNASDSRLAKIATLGADLDLSNVDRISAEGSYNARSDHSTFAETATEGLNSGLSQSGRDRPGREQEISNSAMLRYHHDTEANRNGITLIAQRAQTWERQRFAITNSTILPFADPTFQNQNLYRNQVTREISAEYVGSLPGSAKLIAGYNLQRDDTLFDNGQTLPAAAGAAALPDTNFTNIFRYGQTIHAFYGSYERPIGAWTLLAGVRLEQADITTHQITSGQRGGYGFFRAYPNLHLTDKLSPHQTLSLSYGKRVIRPDPEDLNPYLVQQDPYTLRQGNPGLRPQEIQSFEAGWSYDKGATSRSATLYLRSARNAFTITSTPVSPTVVLITEQNLGKSLSGGLEVATAGKVMKGLDYTLSGNIFYNQIDAANLGFTGTRSTFGYEAKGALNWHMTAADTLQINLATAGKRLTPQGYRRGYVVMDLGYRHQLRKNLALTATVSDVFSSRHDGLIVDTPTLQEVTLRRQSGLVASIGLSWTLAGAKKKAAEKFDYEK